MNFWSIVSGLSGIHIKISKKKTISKNHKNFENAYNHLKTENIFWNSSDFQTWSESFLGFSSYTHLKSTINLFWIFESGKISDFGSHSKKPSPKGP